MQRVSVKDVRETAMQKERRDNVTKWERESEKQRKDRLAE